MDGNDGRTLRTWWPLLGVAAAVATAVGFSGVGDAPDPHAAPATVAAWFTSRQNSILGAAPFGYLGAIAVVLFVTLLAGHLRSAGRGTGSRIVVVGGFVAATYLTFAHATWTTLAYQDREPAVAHALFGATILATPVFGIGLALMMGGTAVVGARSRTIPRWWCWASGLAGAMCTAALVSFGDGGFFSPDVQQQFGANALIAWLLVSSGVVLVRSRRLRERA